MSNVICAGNWEQVKGRTREQWGKLTDNDLASIAGKREQLAKKLQSYYGLTPESAEKWIADFERRFAAAAGK